MKYDYKSLYEKNAGFFAKHPTIQSVLQPASHVLTALFVFAYALLVYKAFYTPYEVRDLLPILCAPPLCLTIVTVLRYAVSRPRPYAKNGANITPLAKKNDSESHSFPSRHVACAFVIATLLLPTATLVGIFLLLLGFALAYIRFALGLHYPTDLFGGILVGVLCGLWIFF